MNLIDCHRLYLLIKLLSVLDPCGILPFIVCDICDPGGCTRTEFSFICIGICLIKLLSMRTHDKEFIQLSDLCPRNKYLINTDRTNLLHRVCFFLPVIKFTNYRNRLCIRCPDRKIYTLFSSVCSRMGTQFLIYFIIGSLSK